MGPDEVHWWSIPIADETGIANVILTSDVFENNPAIATHKPLLRRNALQNQDDLIYVKVHTIALLVITRSAARLRDFH